MPAIPSYVRVSEKRFQYADIFKYMPPAAPEIIYGPQEESDAYEAKLDKCIADRVDYFAEELGYDPIEHRKEVAAIKEYFA